MQTKATTSHEMRIEESPLDHWKSSEGHPHADFSDSEDAFGEISKYEAEGNIPLNQSERAMNNFRNVANRGIAACKKAARASSEWIKDYPVLALGTGLFVGYLLGHQIKKGFWGKPKASPPVGAT